MSLSQEFVKPNGKVVFKKGFPLPQLSLKPCEVLCEKFKSDEILGRSEVSSCSSTYVHYSLVPSPLTQAFNSIF